MDFAGDGITSSSACEVSVGAVAEIIKLSRRTGCADACRGVMEMWFEAALT
jgi:hypothetical protein